MGAGDEQPTGPPVGVEATAYLVNESRSRLPDLSRDPIAPHWIPRSMRSDVADMWEGYAEAVYPYDDLVVSLRCRAVLDVIERSAALDDGVLLVSLGAGFTSYPWLAPVGAALEVDLPGASAAKADRAARLRDEGILPTRDVVHVAADLARPDATAVVRDAIDEVDATAPVVLVVEGVVYYLPEVACRALLSLPSVLGDRLVGAAVSYWPSGAEEHPVLARQRAWFAETGVPTEATHLRPAAVVDALGPGSVSRGTEDLQRWAGLDRLIPEAHLVPEHVAWVAP